MFLIITITFFIVVTSAILSIIESAILYFDEIKLSGMVQSQIKNFSTIQCIIKNKEQHLSSIIMLITFISISGSSILGALAIQEFEQVWLMVFTVSLTYCMLVFSKILPKIYALQVADKVLEHSAPFVYAVTFIMKPFLALTMFWMKLFKITNNDQPSLEELKGIIKYYNSTGILAKSDRYVLEQTLKSKKRTLESIKQPNHQTEHLEASQTVIEIRSYIMKYPAKRYLVTEKGEVVGIASYHSITRHLINKNNNIKISELAKKTTWLKSSDTLLDAIMIMQEKRISVALIRNVEEQKTYLVTAKKVYQSLLQNDI